MIKPNSLRERLTAAFPDEFGKDANRLSMWIEEGHVRIDGRRVEKPSDHVEVGSVVALPLHEKVRILRVLALPERRGPAREARACYEELGIDERNAPS